jgi:DNA invertase Pin-like site-specific DNA recombinase
MGRPLQMKAAIYCRVSTEEQDADKQEYICLEHCKRADIEVYKVYKDVISGTTTSRPQFDEMLKDMREYKFNMIIVTRLDRIGRSVSHILSLFNEFQTKHIGFVSITQNIDTTTATGKLQLHILSAFAEFERNLISERTKEGMKRAKNVGKRGKDKSPRKNQGYKERWKRGGLKKNPFQ